MPNVSEDVPECTGHRLMPSPQCQPLAPVSLPSQSRGGRQWTPLAHGKGVFPEFKGITELVLEAGITVFPRDQTSPAHSAGGHARGPFCILGQLPYHCRLKIYDGEVISRPLAPSPLPCTQSLVALLVPLVWGSPAGLTLETGCSKRRTTGLFHHAFSLYIEADPDCL